MKVRITDRDVDGRGRGHAGQRVVLVPQAHPGELVTVRVDRKSRGLLQGRVAQLLEADPDRISHPCPHEFACTGCTHLALAPEKETRLKHATIESLVAQAAPDAVEKVQAVRTPAGPFGYRCHAKQVFVRHRGRVQLGAFVAGTRRVVGNPGCPVLAPPLRQLMDEVAAEANAASAVISTQVSDGPSGTSGLRYAVGRWSLAEQRALLTLVTDAPRHEDAKALLNALVEGHVGLAGGCVVLNQSTSGSLMSGTVTYCAGEQHIEEALLGHRYRIGPRSFFQVNPVAASELFNITIEAAGQGSLCVEGFAGVGALTLPLAKQFDRVVAVESVVSAVTALEETAASHGIDNIEAHCDDAYNKLAELLRVHRPEVVVLDPPRKGLGHELASAIASTPVERVVLLSCDPKTLVRDLPPLLGGGLSIKTIVPVDQFPRTAHVETVTVLAR